MLQISSVSAGNGFGPALPDKECRALPQDAASFHSWRDAPDRSGGSDVVFPVSIPLSKSAL